MSEYDSEPVRGLPELLPAGETLLWQGSPDWVALARRAFHATAAAAYIGGFAIYTLISRMQHGAALTEAARPAINVLIAGLIGIALLALLAWLNARSTVYTITDRRTVMRFGVALPMAINIPHSLIGSADLKEHGDGTGDLVLSTAGPTRLGYVPLWPHVRPWRINKPQPMLRCIPDAAAVGEILAGALAASHGTTAKRIGTPASAPSRDSTATGGHASPLPA